MKQQLFFTSFALAVVAVLFNFWKISETHAQTNNTQQVTIKFQAMVGDKPFSCGNSYTGLGKPATTLTLSDSRFYVSDVALIDEKGKLAPLTLNQDGKWQYQNVALLDFENKTGACANGTVETRDIVVGSVPPGNYKGLQFTLGVPFNLNHEDATVASSPLNLTSLWWNWRGGYKFMRIDLQPNSAISAGMKHQDKHESVGFPIHLGSTGCESVGDNQKPSSCSHPNTAKVILGNFIPNKNVVIADLKALVADTNLTGNQTNTAPGCMSEPTDTDCSGIMANIGLPFNGKFSPGQTFFKVK
ncbi:metallo-mystery pair system four-Cys motif protein [Chlorogloeopsis sp. ULAP01]|uniref:MbnP family copper-binding protein n=1 Tax=Chlorogloeopsis sp. ULAP01 TaxID=3056483 RepID=UPI0025AAD4AA|nr:MbnP family copper-binding protein [Chlorogloeopsis sp. ULAP01]MDM9385285.1 metallo-mystery pair system four-Cys motif protein [Chlorogloeopsis sp. ULAP01]